MVQLRIMGRLSPRLAQWALPLSILLGAHVARAEDSSSQVQECMAQHERSQVLKRSGELLAAGVAARECAREICPGVVRADCFEWLKQVELATPSVLFRAESGGGDESDVRVYVDDRLLAESLTGQAVAVDPGRHVFRFELGSFPPQEVNVVLLEGEKDRLLSVSFGETKKPKAEAAGAAVPSPPTERPVTAGVYVAASLALVAAGSATYFGLTMREDYRDAEAACAPFCDDSRIEELRRRGYAADASLGVAVASALVAGVLYLVRPEVPVEGKANAQLRFRTAGSRRGGELLLGGRF